MEKICKKSRGKRVQFQLNFDLGKRSREMEGNHKKWLPKRCNSREEQECGRTNALNPQDDDQNRLELI